jgi:small basic protein (TIGR04137 family)
MTAMTIHRSFAGGGAMNQHRNVLTRAERIERLKAQGRWDKERGVFKLPKVRNIKMT